MGRLLEGFSNYSYAALRIVAGAAFAQHGAQKLFGVFGGDPPVEWLSLMGLAGAIELCGGVLVAVGLLTRYAAFVSSGLMAAAYFMAHANRGFWPIENEGELAVLFCFLFLYITSRGSGPLSLGGTRA